MKRLLFAILSLALLASGCSTKSNAAQPTPSPSVEPIVTPSAQSTSNEKKECTYGDTFVFDGFELTITEAIDWSQVNNQFSEQYGQDVALVPVHIKNISGETGHINMFYISLFGSKGTEVKEVSGYFENILGYSGDLRDKAEKDEYLAFLYDGDGDYYVEFKSFTEKIEVRLPITK